MILYFHFCMFFFSCQLQWLETVLSTAMRKRSGEERKLVSSKFGLPNCQPLVCFALCTGAHSDPLVNLLLPISDISYLYFLSIVCSYLKILFLASHCKVYVLGRYSNKLTTSVLIKISNNSWFWR